VPKTIFRQGVYRIISVQYVETKTLGKSWQDQIMDFGEKITKHHLGRKGGKNNQTTEGGKNHD
jgi:hypothetical protein